MVADRTLLEAACRAAYPEASEVAHIGSGGFACTFRVVTGGATRAVKVIEPGRADPERVAREVTALQSVSHPRVVGFLGSRSTTFQGNPYSLVEMQYVPGESIAQLMGSGRRFTVAESIRLLEDACEGAAAIWAVGTAHRDLSPNNLLVGSDGRLTIVDLGLCRNVDDATITALPMPGTPGWMAPEQIGPDGTHGDWRTDQFVLGLVGYSVATGLSPFHARNVMLLWAAPLYQSVRPADEVDPSLPSSLARLLDRMLQKEPHRRFPRPDVLLTELGLVQVGPAPQDMAPSPAEFHLLVGHGKNYVDQTFLTDLAAEGVILDGAMTSARPDLARKAQAACSHAIFDPVTYNGRSPIPVRSKAYAKLSYGARAVQPNAPDSAQIAEWVRDVLSASTSAGIVIAPYWYAALGEIDWINASIAAGTEARRQLADTNDARRVWTGVAVASQWLAHEARRNSLLAAITAAGVENLYLLVDTGQASFRPLKDAPTLIGFRDLLQVLRGSGTNVIVGRRATSGLLFLAMGAAGWSTGISSIQQNMHPHPEESSRAGRPQDRCYVPRLLSVLTTASLVNFLRSDPTVLEPDTPYIHELMTENPTLTDLSTDQRVLLCRHNISAQRVQARTLALLHAGPRIHCMRDWLDDAKSLFLTLPAGAHPEETAEFVTAWQTVL